MNIEKVPLPSHFYAPVAPTPVTAPSWLATNEPLGAVLGLSDLRSPGWLAVLAGNAVPAGVTPTAWVYAGHQFGHFVPRLGDGRAILLGDVLGTDGVRREVQLKGAGRTPFSRGGDGRAALGPVLREFVVSEAMFALGVPTTRALAAVRTGERVFRETPLPGAVLTRVAASHLRVGTFEYFANQGDQAALSALVQYALARHYPDRIGSEPEALALWDGVMEAQIKLVARWMALGFVHGVMNTDNCAISGETLDYGPAAFLDAYDPGRTFSAIDQNGRYAFGNQPRIVLWNLARLAETLIPLLGPDEKKTVALLEDRLGAFAGRFEAVYGGFLGAKLGFGQTRPEDIELAQVWLGLMAGARADYTQTFRQLTDHAAGAALPSDDFWSASAVTEWLVNWRKRLAKETDPAARMRQNNPAFIPRNHQIEAMIAAATDGDLGPLERLRAVLARPYEDQPEAADLATPPGPEQWGYRTFCGT